MKNLCDDILQTRAFTRKMILLIGTSSVAFGLFCSCAPERPRNQASSSGHITCQLIAQPTGKETGQVRLLIHLHNTGASNEHVLEPTDGLNVKYFYRELNAKNGTFYPLLLPTDGLAGAGEISLPPGKSISHETILGLDPGDYEIYALYSLKAVEKHATWHGTSQSSGVLIHIPAGKRRN